MLSQDLNSFFRKLSETACVSKSYIFNASLKQYIEHETKIDILFEKFCFHLDKLKNKILKHKMLKSCKEFQQYCNIQAHVHQTELLPNLTIQAHVCQTELLQHFLNFYQN